VKKKEINIRNPESVRPWQHVLEPLSGYLAVGQKLLEGKNKAATSWNFGPDKDQCLKVKEVLNLFGKQWKDLNVVYPEKNKNAFHEAGILMLDHSKATKELKWKPVWKINTCVEKTAAWYQTFYATGKLQTQNDLAAYVTEAKNKKLDWAK
jgi:CDP-glucose 4,6-dehydratase